jgi:hypothetical protein
MKLVFSRRLLLIPAAVAALLWCDAATTQGQQAVNPKLTGPWCYKLVCYCEGSSGSCDNTHCNFASHADALAHALTVVDTCCYPPVECSLDIYMTNSSAMRAAENNCTAMNDVGTRLQVIARPGDEELTDDELKDRAKNMMDAFSLRTKFGGKKNCGLIRLKDVALPK